MTSTQPAVRIYAEDITGFRGMKRHEWPPDAQTSVEKYHRQDTSPSVVVQPRIEDRGQNDRRGKEYNRESLTTSLLPRKVQ